MTRLPGGSKVGFDSHAAHQFVYTIQVDIWVFEVYDECEIYGSVLATPCASEKVAQQLAAGYIREAISKFPEEWKSTRILEFLNNDRAEDAIICFPSLVNWKYEHGMTNEAIRNLKHSQFRLRVRLAKVAI